MATAEDIYLFAHAAYRDVAYALQLPSERGRLHALALRIMEAVYAGELDHVALELAAHARVAREHLPPAEAAALAEAEAGHIMRALLRATAKEQTQLVVTLAELLFACPATTLEQRSRALGIQAGCLRDVGRSADAEQAWLSLIEIGRAEGDYRSLVSSLTLLASTRALRGDHDSARAMYDEAEAICARHPMPEVHARLYVDRAVAGIQGTEPEELLNQAVELVKDQPESSTWLAVQGSLANHYGNTGRRPDAIRILRGLVRACLQRNERRFLSVSWANLGRQLLLDGRLEESEHSLKQASTVTAEIGNGRTRAFALASLAEVQTLQGRLDQAVESIGTALDIIRDFDAPMYFAAYLCTLANLHLLEGRTKEAAEAADEARFEFERARSGMFVPEYCGIVRLRLAAEAACSGRETPLASWLPVMHAELKTITAAHADRGRPGTLLDTVLHGARALVSEVESAISAQRPPLVFRGHVVSELTPALRLELRGRITEAEAAWMRRCNVELWNALHA